MKMSLNHEIDETAHVPAHVPAWRILVTKLGLKLRSLYTPNRPVFDFLFVAVGLFLLGDWVNYYYLPFVSYVPLMVVWILLLLVQMFRFLPVWVNALFVLGVPAYFGVAEIVKRFVPRGLERCPTVVAATITEEDIHKDYSVTKVIQGIESASGNAIMLANDRSTKRPVVVKYYADPDAVESIGFACSLTGDTARVFPTTLKAGKIATSRGEAYYTVQTLAKGEPIDSWLAGGPSTSAKRRCARGLIVRVRGFTDERFCHRDLHPGNVFVASSGSVSFIDVDLGFVTTGSKSEFITQCQRFFFEMPLRLVAFSREHLSEARQGILASWWIYMSSERYGEYSVDQLYMVACAYIVMKRNGILSNIAQNKNTFETWVRVEKATQTALDLVLPTSVIPAGSETSKQLYRFMMGGAQVPGVSEKVEMDDATKAKLNAIYSDFKKTMQPPRVNIVAVTSKEFKTTVEFKNRLSVDITIPPAVSIEIITSPGPINEIIFGIPLVIATTGLELRITYIKVDKSTQIDTKYNVEGEGVVAGGVTTFSIQNVLGEVVTPNGPLPTGNEVIAMLASIKFSDDDMRNLLLAVGTVEVSVARPENQPNDTFIADFTDPTNVVLSST